MNTTVAFTGHRSYRGEAQEALLNTISELYAQGYRTFMSGMAVGFDLAAAEAVITLRRGLTALRLVAVVPFDGQQQRFCAKDKLRFEAVLRQADEVVVLSSVYHSGVYRVRNDYLVDHASVVVACYDGSPGGTRYTLQRAERSGRVCRNISPHALRQTVSEPELF